MAKNLLLFSSCCLALFLSIVSCTNAREAPASYGYDPKVDVEKPKQEKEDHPSTTLPVAVEGVITCRSGSKLNPLKGAVVRLTCLCTDEEGYELPPFSKLTPPTDENGYFFTVFAASELDEVKELSECKAFLNSSPSDTCNIPTNVNHGIGGAKLDSYRILKDSKMKLHSVGPFAYTSDPTTVNKGY